MILALAMYNKPRRLGQFSTFHDVGPSELASGEIIDVGAGKRGLAPRQWAFRYSRTHLLLF